MGIDAKLFVKSFHRCQYPDRSPAIVCRQPNCKMVFTFCDRVGCFSWLDPETEACASGAGACAPMGALVCKCGHPFPFMNHMDDYEYNGDKIRMLPSSVDGRLRE